MGVVDGVCACGGADRYLARLKRGGCPSKKNKMRKKRIFVVFPLVSPGLECIRANVFFSLLILLQIYKNQFYIDSRDRCSK